MHDRFRPPASDQAQFHPWPGAGRYRLAAVGVSWFDFIKTIEEIEEIKRGWV